MSGVISNDIATKEVNDWVSFQGITDKQKENLSVKNSINRMIQAVEEGTLIIDGATKVITQKLKFPFGEEIKISELKFKPHLTVGNIINARAGLDDDEASVPLGYISAATGEPVKVLLKMNSKDYKLSDTIILFFML